MHEYEFRLVIEHSSSLVPLLDAIVETWTRSGKPHVERSIVPTVFAKPHFRCRHQAWETKRKRFTCAVYHDDVWFQWVHSVETPFTQWSRATHAKFIDVVGNYQHPLTHETRVHVQLDRQACLYAFEHRLVFEWEYGSFPEPVSSLSSHTLLDGLSEYRDVYTVMRGFPPPAYKLNEAVMRKSVTCVDELPLGPHYKVAHKVDGVFGFVFSYKDYTKEKWENFEQRQGTTSMGDGFVFAAEKYSEVTVLLDVYQVRGFPVATWSRRAIFEHFLPKLQLPAGYYVQHYADRMESLPDSIHPTDGYIVHDMISDKVFKLKTAHSIDVVYDNGWFNLSNNMRFPYREQPLKNGYVYEVTMEGQVLRLRRDRCTGNTPKQLEKIMQCNPWMGPDMESFEPKEKRRKKKVNK